MIRGMVLRMTDPEFGHWFQHWNDCRKLLNFSIPPYFKGLLEGEIK